MVLSRTACEYRGQTSSSKYKKKKKNVISIKAIDLEKSTSKVLEIKFRLIVEKGVELKADANTKYLFTDVADGSIVVTIPRKDCRYY